jgi:hypothetical protein
MPGMTCIACKSKLSVDDIAEGGKVECRICGNALTIAECSGTENDAASSEISAINLPPRDEVVQDSNRECQELVRDATYSSIELASDSVPDSAADAARKNWTAVRAGLRIVWVAALLALIQQLSTHSAVLYYRLASPRAGDIYSEDSTLFFQFSCSLSFASGGISILGAWICGAAPDLSAARRARVAAALAATTFIAIVVSKAYVLSSARENRVGIEVQKQIQKAYQLEAVDTIAVAIGDGLFFASAAFWLLFHAAIGRAVGDRRVMKDSYGLLFLAIVARPLPRASVYFAKLMGLSGSTSTMMFTGANFMAATLIYGCYLVLCRRTIAAIDAVRR